MVISATGEAYDRAAELWRRGPEQVYARLAEALLSVSPVALEGARVLDVGAGTAVVARAALDRGASCAVALDLAPGMLRYAGPQVHPVLADVARVPFADGSFDLVTAACCLSHLSDPGAALIELRRVGTGVLASAFAPDNAHPAKAAVDAVLAGFGFEAPDWYRHLKFELEPRVDDQDGLAALADAAGFGTAKVVRINVDAGLDSGEAIADWRLGMAHLGPFVAALDPATQARARSAAIEAVTGMPPVLIGMLALSAA